MTNKDFIGARLKEARKAMGYSLEYVAEACRIQQYQTVSNWENGNTFPSLEKLLLLCQLYGCDLGYIIGEYDCKTRKNTDIQAETGLSEKAINQIKTDSIFKPSRIKALNALIEFNGAEILEVVADYLFNKEKPVELEDGRVLSAETIYAAHLLDISGELRAIRTKTNGGME